MFRLEFAFVIGAVRIGNGSSRSDGKNRAAVKDDLSDGGFVAVLVHDHLVGVRNVHDSVPLSTA